MALDALPNFTALPGEGEHLRGAISISPSVDDMERAYDDAKYGRFSAQAVHRHRHPDPGRPVDGPAGQARHELLRAVRAVPPRPVARRLGRPARGVRRRGRQPDRRVRAGPALEDPRIATSRRRSTSSARPASPRATSSRASSRSSSCSSAAPCPAGPASGRRSATSGCAARRPIRAAGSWAPTAGSPPWRCCASKRTRGMSGPRPEPHWDAVVIGGGHNALVARRLPRDGRDADARARAARPSRRRGRHDPARAGHPRADARPHGRAAAAVGPEGSRPGASTASRSSRRTCGSSRRRRMGRALTLWADVAKTATALAGALGATTPTRTPGSTSGSGALGGSSTTSGERRRRTSSRPASATRSRGLSSAGASRAWAATARGRVLRVLPMAVADLVADRSSRDALRAALAWRGVRYGGRRAVVGGHGGDAAARWRRQRRRRGRARRSSRGAVRARSRRHWPRRRAARERDSHLRTRSAHHLARRPRDRRRAGGRRGDRGRRGRLRRSTPSERSSTSSIPWRSGRRSAGGPATSGRPASSPRSTSRSGSCRRSRPPAATRRSSAAGSWSRPAIDAMERAFDATKYGRWSEQPILEATIPSLADPSLVEGAKAGTHVMSVIAQYAPYDARADADWEDQARGVRRRRDRGPGVRGAGHRQARLAPPGPHAGRPRARVRADGRPPAPRRGRASTSSSSGARCSATPATESRWSGLYLCGSGAHPGGGITGGPGQNAAREILETCDAPLARPRLGRPPSVGVLGRRAAPQRHPGWACLGPLDVCDGIGFGSRGWRMARPSRSTTRAAARAATGPVCRCRGRTCRNSAEITAAIGMPKIAPGMPATLRPTSTEPRTTIGWIRSEVDMIRGWSQFMTTSQPIATTIADRERGLRLDQDRHEHRRDPGHERPEERDRHEHAGDGGR